MATYSKKASTNKGSNIQVFAHHGANSNLPDAITLTAGDIIDVTGSIGKPASKCMFVLRGSIEITIKFNEPISILIPNDYGPPSRQEGEIGLSNISALRLLNSSGTQIFNFDGMSIGSIYIVDAGSPSSTNYIEILVA